MIVCVTHVVIFYLIYLYGFRHGKCEQILANCVIFSNLMTEFIPLWIGLLNPDGLLATVTACTDTEMKEAQNNCMQAMNMACLKNYLLLFLCSHFIFLQSAELISLDLTNAM